MHKDQYTDAPLPEQVRVKTMLNSTISDPTHVIWTQA